MSELLTATGDLLNESDREKLATRVEALRAHISETYRLHRRMIRHRRSQVLTTDDESATMPFEVTGRQAPEMIPLDSPGQQLTQDGLLQWQSQVANWLIDHDAEDQSAAYGRILAVLVSRADGVSQDPADALRWRLDGDSKAATRAGLTEEERSILRGPQVVPAEARVLDLLTGQSGAGEQVRALVEVLLPVFRKNRRIVVFCGPGALAASLAASLRRRIPNGRIGEHTARQNAAAAEEAVGQWREHGGILVADGSAEDGLNLQDADAVVHARLPWSPNRLEQRIGRVDRYGEGSGQAARQYVVTSPDGEDAFPGAWLHLLTGAFGIFSQSVSALQDSIDQGLTAIWAAGMTDGPAGLVGLEARVREDLASERREIDEMDMVDSIHESGSGTRDIPAAIGTLEDGWRDIESAVVGYAGDGAEDCASPITAGAPAATRGVRAGKTRSAAGPADLRPGRGRTRARGHARRVQPDVGIAHSGDPLVPGRQPLHRHAREHDRHRRPGAGFGVPAERPARARRTGGVFRPGLPGRGRPRGRPEGEGR